MILFLPCKNCELCNIYFLYYTTKKKFSLSFNWDVLNQFKPNFSDANLTSIFTNNLQALSLLVHLVFNTQNHRPDKAVANEYQNSRFNQRLRGSYIKQDEGKDCSDRRWRKDWACCLIQHGNGQSWATGSLNCPSHTRIYSNKESRALASDTRSACTI